MKYALYSIKLIRMDPHSTLSVEPQLKANLLAQYVMIILAMIIIHAHTHVCTQAHI